MFIDNDWWGHKFVLAKYCGLKIKPIFGSIQHGVYTLEEELEWNLKKKRNFKILPYFCYSKYFSEKCKKNKINNVISIGSPFLYLDKLKIQKKIKQRKGTIVFPAHSGFKKTKKGLVYKYDKQKRMFDHINFIKNIEKHNSPPFTVSIIKDDLDDISNFYKRKNWKIFSAGNRYDNLFLSNIHKMISQNSHAVFCEFTSALFYSMYMGLKVRIAVKSINSNKIVTYGKKIFKTDKRSFFKYQKKYPEIFSGHLTILKGKKIAKERMGYDCLKSKDELKKILGWDSNLKLIFSIILKMLYNFKYNFRKYKN